MSRLWPDSFVEESNLTFNIQQLRKALGDSARQPRFIETVPRRGYRFIAEVKQGFDNIAATTEITKSAAAAIPRASRRTYLFVAAAAVLAISSAVGWERRKSVTSSGRSSTSRMMTCMSLWFFVTASAM